jgi:FkbM family methyltransferase
MIRLRCELAIPSGLRRSKLLVRIESDGPQSLVLLPARGMAEATHLLVDAAGVPLLVHLSEKDSVSAEIIRQGFWGLPETLAMLASVRPGSRVVDVGAHFGYYSVLAARSARTKGRIYSFDPAPQNHLVLSANSALSALLNPDAATIETSELAIADRSGNVRLYLSDQNPTDHSITQGTNSAIQSLVVPAATIDLLRWPGEQAQREGSSIIDGPVDVIKINIAGGEFAVLQGCERTLIQDCPLLIVAFRPASVGIEPCVSQLEWLANRGYTTFRAVPPQIKSPYFLMTEAAGILNLNEAAERIRKKMVPRKFALIAYPDSVHPSITSV